MSHTLEPSANASNTSVTTQPAASRSFWQRTRWISLALLIVSAVAVQLFLWIRANEDNSQAVMSSLVMFPLTGLLIVLWWTFLSGFAWRKRFVGLGIVGLAAVIFLTLFRFEGLAGDFIPQFGYRFKRSSEEQAATFFDKQSGKTVSLPSGTLEVTAADWAEFRGPQRDGVAAGERVRSDWDSNPPKALWKHPIGPAWSSFAIVGDLIFTQEQRGEQEAVVCYDANSGEQVWVHTDPIRYSTAIGGTGPRATPTIHDSRAYTLGATGMLNCLDALTGKPLWSHDILADAGSVNLTWAMAGSPLIVDDLVIVFPGLNVPEGGSQDMYANAAPSSIVAYDRVTGEKRWAAGKRQASFASPQLAVIDGVRQILYYSAFVLAGHDVATGQELWSFEWKNEFGNNCVQPIVLDDGGIFLSSGYNTGSALIDVKRTGDKWDEPKPRWTSPNKFKLKFNGGVYRDGHIYGLDEGILSCLDLSTGEPTWKKGRYKYGQTLMLADHLLVSTEAGEVVLLDVTPKGAKEIGKFKAIEGKTWNIPVVNRGRLFIRSDQEVACYDISAFTETASVE